MAGSLPGLPQSLVGLCYAKHARGGEPHALTSHSHTVKTLNLCLGSWGGGGSTYPPLRKSRSQAK
eukprot:9856670-Karenia_brevis.AAC.1